MFRPRGALHLANRRPRRPALLLEPLERRQVLSASSATTVITPNVVTADLGTSQSGGDVSASVSNPTPVFGALSPSQIATAYGIYLSSITGSGETIAIVDAYNDPNIRSDLAVFDSTYGLPAANLTVENQYGQTSNLPQTDAGWALEIALDVEWAHVAAPGARIVLVEANSASISDLMTAVWTAANQANVVSMSWGGSEFQGETAFDTTTFFARQGVTFIAASGDDGGASGAEWPAVSPYVVSVGGTTLSLTSSGAIASETAWSVSGNWWSGFSGSAGGVSLYERAPSYQTAALRGTTARRATPDVSSDANPNTGLSVYDSVSGMGQTGWFQVGGTSAGAPLWAGIIAAADHYRAALGKPSLSSVETDFLLYGLYTPSSYWTDFHDMTNGWNFAGSAGPGYDLVTGLGSPVAVRIEGAAAASSIGTSSLASRSLAAATTSAGARLGASDEILVTAHTLATADSNSFLNALSPSPSPTVLAATANTTLSAVSRAEPPATGRSSVAWTTTFQTTPSLPIRKVETALANELFSDRELFAPDTPQFGTGWPATATATPPNAAEAWWDVALEEFLAESGPAKSSQPSCPSPPDPTIDGWETDLARVLVLGTIVVGWTFLERRAPRREDDPLRRIVIPFVRARSICY
jgi:hypothetical protein